MNYKETLFFIAKCLTISHEEEAKTAVEQALKNNEVDWDTVVQVSTAHYVFPALYCHLKRADFLHYLPEELVNYMIHITNLNRERNLQIITQAKEINELLLANHITSIFLKGTGNLLEGLYDDIAERMVGDIDFLVSKENYQKTYDLLKASNYKNVTKDDYSFPQFKHQPRLNKEDRIAAVEVHKELLLEKYADEFNFDLVSKHTFKKADQITFMSFENQLCLSIIATQINDDGMYFKNIALRNAYDVFLLSKKTNPLKALKSFTKLYHPLNNFLSICSITFGGIESIQFEENDETKKHIKDFVNGLKNDVSTKKKHRKTSQILFIKQRLAIIKKALTRKDHRNWLLKRITDKKWQHEKLIQLGLKKAKPNS
jgi:hypothetical protein